MWSAQVCGSAWPMAPPCGGCGSSLKGRSRMCWYSGVQSDESCNSFAMSLWGSAFTHACDVMHLASKWLRCGP